MGSRPRVATGGRACRRIDAAPFVGFASWRALTREQGLSTRDAGLLVADALIRLKNM